MIPAMSIARTGRAHRPLAHISYPKSKLSHLLQILYLSLLLALDWLQ